MFDINFLHTIRSEEYNDIVRYFYKGAKILEIGGGTGHQANKLTQDGYEVISIDLAESNYAGNYEFPIQLYDGENLPFPDNSIDIIFSSNVLEHVKNLSKLNQECIRVLRPNGYCIHILPSGTWCFWTIVTHYVELFLKPVSIINKFNSIELIQHSLRSKINIILNDVFSFIFKNPTKWFVFRHGERGSTLTEIYLFSRISWKKHFTSSNFKIEIISPMGLFYTGNMLLGSKLNIKARRYLSGFLGSACTLYKLEPRSHTPN